MGNPKSGRCCLREFFITKFKSQFKWGFAKVVVTRAGRLQEWSQGELRLQTFLEEQLRICAKTHCIVLLVLLVLTRGKMKGRYCFVEYISRDPYVAVNCLAYDLDQLI